METYTLRIAETQNAEGIDADILDSDGLVQESTRVSYEDYGVNANRSDWKPDDVEREITADVTTMNLQVSRSDGTFQFRLLGDRDELHRERIGDDDWRLDRTEE